MPWPVPRVGLGRQQVQHHRGDERPRKEVAREHRKYHRHRQRREQRPAHPADEQDRHEHDADRQGRDERRCRHLRRPVEDRLPQRLAQLHLAVIVLDLDRGVVHQNSHRQRQSTQGHHVERLVQDVEHDDGGQDRQWDRRDDDQGAPPGPQEQQDHQRRQAAGGHCFVDDPVIAARTKTLWSNRKSTLRLGGRPARILGISSRTRPRP